MFDLNDIYKDVNYSNFFDFRNNNYLLWQHVITGVFNDEALSKAFYSMIY
jgi:hypothetical protein